MEAMEPLGFSAGTASSDGIVRDDFVTDKPMGAWNGHALFQGQSINRIDVVLGFYLGLFFFQ